MVGDKLVVWGCNRRGGLPKRRGEQLGLRATGGGLPKRWGERQLYERLGGLT